MKAKEQIKKENNKMLKKVNIILVTVILINSALFMIYFGIKTLLWSNDNKEIEDQTKEINVSTVINEKEDDKKTEKVNPPKNESDPYWDYIKIPLISVEFDELLKQNSDTVGWINVGDTNINYPVVQTSDNDYYLSHAFNKKYNDAGWIYMDYRNNSKNFDKNTIIYGHSRYDKSMFGSLRNVVKKSWFDNKSNHIIKFSTPKENTLWQVFSTYTVKAESYYITTDFYDDEIYVKWLNDMHKRSIYDFKTSISKKDKVLTLSSCYTSDGVRVVLHAKLIKRETRT